MLECIFDQRYENKRRNKCISHLGIGEIGGELYIVGQPYAHQFDIVFHEFHFLMQRYVSLIVII